MADGEEVVLWGDRLPMTSHVECVGLIQIPHCLLCALSDCGQQESSLGQQSGPRPHCWATETRREERRVLCLLLNHKCTRIYSQSSAYNPRESWFSLTDFQFYIKLTTSLRFFSCKNVFKYRNSKVIEFESSNSNGNVICPGSYVWLNSSGLLKNGVLLYPNYFHSRSLWLYLDITHMINCLFWPLLH